MCIIDYVKSCFLSNLRRSTNFWGRSSLWTGASKGKIRPQYFVNVLSSSMHIFFILKQIMNVSIREQVLKHFEKFFTPSIFSCFLVKHVIFFKWRINLNWNGSEHVFHSRRALNETRALSVRKCIIICTPRCASKHSDLDKDIQNDQVSFDS